MHTVSIAIIGDFNPEFRSHHATTPAIKHAAAFLGIDASVEWVPTPLLENGQAASVLSAFDGLWISPGSPYKSFEGMLAGISFARENDWPLVAT